MHLRTATYLVVSVGLLISEYFYICRDVILTSMTPTDMIAPYIALVTNVALEEPVIFLLSDETSRFLRTGHVSLSIVDRNALTTWKPVLRRRDPMGVVARQHITCASAYLIICGRTRMLHDLNFDSNNSSTIT